MYQSDFYGLQSELEYRKERARTWRRPRRRPSDPYGAWLLRYGGGRNRA